MVGYRVLFRIVHNHIIFWFIVFCVYCFVTMCWALLYLYSIKFSWSGFLFYWIISYSIELLCVMWYWLFCCIVPYCAICYFNLFLRYYTILLVTMCLVWLYIVYYFHIHCISYCVSVLFYLFCIINFYHIFLSWCD